MPAGKVSVPTCAMKSVPAVADPDVVVKSTVAVEVNACEIVTVKIAIVVPPFPSVTDRLDTDA